MQSRRHKPWRKLDNAALLFSATSNERDPRVFRFYCELKEEVVPEILQQALNETTVKYPVFLSVMRKGLFWHYFEQSNLEPIVRQEYKAPCSPLYIRDKKTLLFEVTYYRRRINFEIFHGLTDGTGATEFLRELVKRYLLLRYREEGLPDRPLGEENITVQDQEDDSFSKYYSKDVKPNKVHKVRAFQLKKIVRGYGELRISEGLLPVAELLATARQYGVSVTVLLTTVLIWAIHQEMSRLQEKKPIVLMVPVNLRKFFTSASLLNFFSWIEPGYQFGQGADAFEDVLMHVKEYFREKLTQENMAARINEVISLEKHPVLRFFPLDIKNWGISTGAKRAEHDVTAILSNMSTVMMPPEYVPYIERFGVYTSTPKLELSMCSFEGYLNLSFTSRFDTTNIIRNFYQKLADIGVPSEPVEPEYPAHDTPNLTGLTVFKIFSFLCIFAAVTAIAINVMYTPGSYWSLLTAGGIASLWAALSLGYYKRHNLLKDAMWQLILITCGCMIWDALTGWKGWSIDYVFPGISMAVTISMIVITRLQSHKASEYMIYLVMAALYSCVIPFILLLVGAVQFIYLAVIAAAFGFLLVLGLMIFRWKEFKEELYKNFRA